MSNKLPKPDSQTQRKCVFCGGSPLTKEHLLPDWLKTVIFKDPEIKNHTAYNIPFVTDGHEMIISPSIRTKSGHPMSKKLLIVCKTCNSGWMSLLQSQTKPLLTSLILEDDIELNDDDLIQLSKWIVMTNMVVEFDDLKSKVIPSQQLKDFKINSKVPHNWKIWAGRYHGDHKGIRGHHNGIKLKTLFESSYVQFFLLNIENVFIYAVSSNSEEI